MPHVQGLHEQHADNPNVVILAMNVGDDNEKMKKWWAKKEYTFPTLNDADELAGEYGVRAFPSSVLIDPDGNVVAARVGSASEMAAELEELLEALESDENEEGDEAPADEDGGSDE